MTLWLYASAPPATAVPAARLSRHHRDRSLRHSQWSRHNHPLFAASAARRPANRAPCAALAGTSPVPAPSSRPQPARRHLRPVAAPSPARIPNAKRDDGDARSEPDFTPPTSRKPTIQGDVAAPRGETNA